MDSYLPSYEDTYEVLFLEKQELSRERGRLMEAIKELDIIKKRIHIETEDKINKLKKMYDEEKTKNETELKKMYDEEKTRNETVIVTITMTGDDTSSLVPYVVTLSRYFLIKWSCGSFKHTEYIIYREGMRRGEHCKTDPYWEIYSMNPTFQWHYFNGQMGAPIEYKALLQPVGNVTRDLKCINPWINLISQSIDDQHLIRKIASAIQSTMSTYSSYNISTTPFEEFVPNNDYFQKL